MTLPLDTRHTRRSALAVLGTHALWPDLARARAWPSKPIRLVVPFAPGGSAEIVARATAAELAKILGRSVYVDNKPGGGGDVAMAEVARADDRHRLILGPVGTRAVNPFIFEKLPHDPVKVFRGQSARCGGRQACRGHRQGRPNPRITGPGAIRGGERGGRHACRVRALHR